MNARAKALEEAASVLLAVSSSKGALLDTDNDDVTEGGGGHDDAADVADSTATSIAAEGTASSISSNLSPAGEGAAAAATAVPADGKTSSKSISRSDMLAMAKRRAEERKRNANSTSSKQQQQLRSPTGEIKPTDIIGSTPATTATSLHKQQQKQQQSSKSKAQNEYNQMDWFNLLGVVTNPTSGHYYTYPHDTASSSASSSRHHYLRASRHNHHHGLRLSSHGTPISLDHVSSDGDQYHGGDNSMAASILHAAGLTDLAGYANASSIAANATLSSMANSVDEFTSWFDHYSRKYLGTVAGIDGPGGGAASGTGSVMSSVLGGGMGGADNEDGIDHNGSGGGGIFHHPNSSSMLALLEYEPEFGPDDIPTSQLETMPVELSNLDLSTVENYLKQSGMLGMRFEDRGGGFMAMRMGRNMRMEEVEKQRKLEMENLKDGLHDDSQLPPDTSSGIAIPTTATIVATTSNSMMDSVLHTVPEMFFSPYFDLTDPICFEDLLVISDEEVARIREKEAELHALADRKVKEAERVAALDAEKNGSVVVVPSSSSSSSSRGVVGKNGDNLMASSLASPSMAAPIAGSATTSTGSRKDAKATLLSDVSPAPPPPAPVVDGNVITLRKPETFTSHLDAVELVLLDQVRSKSERFFRETNRFSELQQLVTGTVDEVRELRDELHSIRDRCVSNVEIVPVMDDTRKDLRRISLVLEAVEDVVNCKASIASLMSVGDHLGAVEAIRLARSLLAGNLPESESNNNMTDAEDGAGSNDSDGGESSTTSSSQQHRKAQPRQFSLGKLKALSKVGEQLNEYEKLVVQNLTNELVESFLSWGIDGNVDYRAQPLLSLTVERRSKIRSVVHSLRVCGKLSDAGVAYQKKLCELISVTIKAIVTECVADATKNSGNVADGTSTTPSAKGTMVGVASMSLEQFFDCINMLFEQVLGLLWSAFAVNKICIDEGFILDDNVHNSGPTHSGNAMEGASSTTDPSSPGERSVQQHTPSATAAALAAAADLTEKSVSELLRLRREAHSIVSFDGMRQLWDTSLAFTHQLEKFSGRKAYGLRSTLMAQAKSFVERKHEANMSALVAALDSERWIQCNVSAERQIALTRLCSGRAAFLSRKAITGSEPIASPGPSAGSGREKMADAEVEGVRYKVVWSSLLLLEMVMDDVACAAHFQTLATNVVGKVAELLRLFNTRSTHLVLGAGAIHSAARLKSINAKHLAIVTQCIALVLAILPHIRAALMAQLPAKQHALLYDLDKIKVDYHDHSEKILSKLVSIIGGIVEHSLVPRIANTNFDDRASNASSSTGLVTSADCCPFLDSVVINTKKMHQVLLLMLPPELLRDVFSRIFAYLDHKVPSLFKAVANSEQAFSMPSTDEGKLQMINEVGFMAKTLNSLEGVQPWNFTATKILEQELDMRRESMDNEQANQQQSEPLEESEHETLQIDSDNIIDAANAVPTSTESSLGENIHATSVLDDKNESVPCGAETGNKRASGPADGCGTVDMEGSSAMLVEQSENVAVDVDLIDNADDAVSVDDSSVKKDASCADDK